MISAIRNRYSKFVENPQYVFKMCGGTRFTILKRLEDTKTNEKRSNIVNPQFAKYRGTKFEVVKIFDRFHPRKEYTNAFSIYDNSFEYVVGKKVAVSNFDEDLDDVCARGIHYYIDIEPAYAHMLMGFDLRAMNFTGTYKLWHENGSPEYFAEYRNGILHGKTEEWYTDGARKKIMFHIDGKENGPRYEWDKKGKIELATNYLNGCIHGNFTEFWLDDVIRRFGTVFHGKKVGTWIETEHYGKVAYLRRYEDDCLKDSIQIDPSKIPQNKSFDLINEILISQ